MYPIRFEPIYQTYIWGGKKIASYFKRPIDEPKVAESWEISDRKEAMSVCANGKFQGKTLHEMIALLGEDLLGKGKQETQFPILTKIIDAHENLSIQVHPNALSASRSGGEPKAEMWIAIEPSSIYVGLKKGVDLAQFEKAVSEKKPEMLLEELELKKGESVFLPGGRVHAISKGSFIYEIQQNSNTTYRIYDWGRGRELHLEKGLEAMRFDSQKSEKLEPKHLSSDLHHQLVILLSSEFFNVERVDVFDQLHLAPIPKSFQLFFSLSGDAVISVDGQEEPFYPGMSYLALASSKSIDFRGKCQFLRTWVS